MTTIQGYERSHERTLVKNTKVLYYIWRKGEEKIYQIITAEGIAKRKNSPIPRNISIEIGTLVFELALVYFMYSPSKITFNQYDIPMANAAPRCPSLDLYTKTQHRGIWKQRVTQELTSKGMIKLCVWKYRTRAWRVP